VTQHIRERINRKLDALGEDRLYQILDYVEFLESRYAQRAATPPNSFQRFADAMEDRLRTGGIAASTVSEAMGFLNRAAGVLNGVAAAGRSVATDLATAAQKAVDVTGQAATGAPPGAAPSPTGAGGAAAPGASGDPAPAAPAAQPPTSAPAGAPASPPPAGGASGTPGAGETSA
jgi:DNA polymerase-3 subunit gamma/tau